jgi:hypothetical protein
MAPKVAHCTPFPPRADMLMVHFGMQRDASLSKKDHLLGREQASRKFLEEQAFFR